MCLLLKSLLVVLVCVSAPLPATSFLKPEPALEKNENTKVTACLETFLAKGGTLHHIPVDEPSFSIQPGDAIYPVCSGGWRRSQTLFALLEPYKDQIVLFPPHAARYGWDPYNGQINRYINEQREETELDEFALYFHKDKAVRVGFENEMAWKAIELNPTPETLAEISRYYDEHFYGPQSSWEGKQGQRRVYVAFSVNAHVVLHRLVQANESLENVHLVACDLEDLITHPPAHLHTHKNSQVAYAHFISLLQELFKMQPKRV